MTITKIVPKNIPANGPDVTDKLQSWLDGIPNGTYSSPIDVSFARKQFCCEGTLQSLDREYLRFRDGGIFATSRGDSHRAHWRAIDCKSIRWLNIRVVGPRKPFTPYDETVGWQHGFDLQGVTGYDLAACIIKGVYGDGVCNSRSPSSRWTTNGHIHSTCQILGTSRQSISFTAADSITVDAMKITDPSLSIFDIEPNGLNWGAKNIIIDGTVIDGTNPDHTYSLLYIADFGGAGSIVENITVKNTFQRGNSVVAVALPPNGLKYKNITISNNTADRQDRAYITLEGIDGLVLERNSVPADKILLTNCT